MKNEAERNVSHVGDRGWRVDLTSRGKTIRQRAPWFSSKQAAADGRDILRLLLKLNDTDRIAATHLISQATHSEG